MPLCTFIVIHFVILSGKSLLRYLLTLQFHTPAACSATTPCIKGRLTHEVQVGMNQVKDFTASKEVFEVILFLTLDKCTWYLQRYTTSVYASLSQWWSQDCWVILRHSLHHRRPVYMHLASSAIFEIKMITDMIVIGGEIQMPSSKGWNLCGALLWNSVGPCSCKWQPQHCNATRFLLPYVINSV